jgi:hypothetical protein
VGRQAMFLLATLHMYFIWTVPNKNRAAGKTMILTVRPVWLRRTWASNVTTTNPTKTVLPTPATTAEQNGATAAMPVLGLSRSGAGAREVLDWPKRCRRLVHAFPGGMGI